MKPLLPGGVVRSVLSFGRSQQPTPRRGSCSSSPGPTSHPYSAECVEGEFSEVELPLYGVLGSSQGRVNHRIHRCVQIRVCVVRRGSPTKKRRRKLYGDYAQRILEAWDAGARGRSGPGALVRRRGPQTANENGSDPGL